MRLDDKHVYLHVYNWFLKQHEYYIKGESKVKTAKKPEPAGDSVHISYKGMRQLKNKYIEDTINSGEPLEGISYDEYCDYIYDKYGYLRDESTEKGYRYALKGDNASLREKEWRTNPQYVIPSRLYNSPAVVLDRNAALEKYRSGENLCTWEANVMYTAAATEEGAAALEQARAERSRLRMQDIVTSGLEQADISLSENEYIDLEMWGYDLTVSGNIAGDKLKRIGEILEKSAMGFQGLYHSYHRSEAEEGGFPLVYLWSAEKALKDEGSPADAVYKIGKDENGDLTGLPDSLGKFIKENAIGRFGFVPDEKYKDRKDDIEKALYLREAFNSAIETLGQGKYAKLKAMTGRLTYKNGVLSC